MPLSIPDTLGAASIGFSVSCVVFGVLTMQAFTYYQRYPEDKWPYKILVAALWALELLDQIFVGYSVYYYTVTHYGNVQVFLLDDVIWTLILQVVLGCFVGTLVKICFTLRVWMFSKRNVYITGFIVILILGQFGVAVLYSIRCFQLNKLVLASQLRLVASLSLGTGLVTDFAIAAALCYFLRRLRTGYRKSDTLVNTLTIYAVNTGALTGALSLLTLILYNARPDTFFFMASYFSLGKLYAISFICTLNTRKVIRGRGTDRQGSSANTSGNARNNTFMLVTPSNARAQRPDFTSHQNHLKSVEIGVHQEVSVIMDLENGDGGHSLPPVAVILLLETADQFFIGHLMYFYSIVNYANPRVLLEAKTTWSFILQLTFGAVVGTIVKVYLAFRVWRFSNRNWFITAFILLLSIGQLGKPINHLEPQITSVLIAKKMFSIRSCPRRTCYNFLCIHPFDVSMLTSTFRRSSFALPSVFAVHQLQTLGTISLATGVTTDFVIAVALCYYLNRLRTGLKTSDNLVNSLCRYAINTGVLTSGVSLTVLILYNVMPTSNLYFIATYFTLSKLYAISFMATLNTRRSVRGRGTDEQGEVSNNTNMFHLGTRMPSMGPNDLERWDKVDPPVQLQEQFYQQQLQYYGQQTLSEPSYSSYSPPNRKIQPL
ncbi:hypothetical protein CVT24_008793 [Panaeolus cyanescens]|uniref:DUF6534 domain-containing protein n=1 Tax=Panaeolus cyanescens TaxID=181874 RepID=A0A409VB51_9AGAR|nr:hypothetical protein CVT24_008793 [Panaeolus cyanescens]